MLDPPAAAVGSRTANRLLEGACQGSFKEALSHMSGRREGASVHTGGGHMRVHFGLGALLACCMLLVAACGSDKSSSSSGGGGGSGGEAKVTGAKAIDPSKMANPPKGTVKFCQGK